MRFLSLFTQLLLPLTVLAAKKAADQDRFQSFRAQPTPIKLDDASYNDLTSAPRDYPVAVLLTALEPRFGCVMCQEFQSEWNLLAKSWTKGDKDAESRLLFGTLDFVDGKATFQSVCIDVPPALRTIADSVPSSCSKPPPFFCSSTRLPAPMPALTSSPSASILPWGMLDIGSVYSRDTDCRHSPQSADGIHAWISRNLPEGPHPPIIRPINYVKIVSVTTAVLGLITFITVAAPYILPVIQNRNLWAAFSLIMVLLFTSGHMFNHIRKVPYVAGDGKGGISYFAGGFQNQFGMETQIVAAVCELPRPSLPLFRLRCTNCLDGVLSFATISLALKVPRIANPKTQQTAVLVWGGLLFLMYSFLLSVFRVKNGGYPFYLPPF